MHHIKNFLKTHLYDYDKQKANLLKSILPFVIIVHHLANLKFEGIGKIGSLGDPAMYIFFAMSGYGLVISYKKNVGYINGFLRRSLPKLFIPYLIALVLFVVYRYIEGIDQFDLFMTKGLFSFVPTSWFIYILSLFYIFFFVCYRFIKSNIVIKTVFTAILVIGYCFLAPYMGISPWRYYRCPAFIVGMVFALMDESIKEKFVRWHILVAIGLLMCMIKLPFGHRLDFFYYPSIIFFVMYSLPGGRLRIVSFFSSISLEMFIIQFIPIYIVTNHIVLEKNFISTLIVVPLVLVLDVLIAFVMHKMVAVIKRVIQL